MISTSSHSRLLVSFDPNANPFPDVIPRISVHLVGLFAELLSYKDLVAMSRVSKSWNVWFRRGFNKNCQNVDLSNCRLGNAKITNFVGIALLKCTQILSLNVYGNDLR